MTDSLRRSSIAAVTTSRRSPCSPPTPSAESRVSPPRPFGGSKQAERSDCRRPAPPAAATPPPSAARRQHGVEHIALPPRQVPRQPVCVSRRLSLPAADHPQKAHFGGGADASSRPACPTRRAMIGTTSGTGRESLHLHRLGQRKRTAAFAPTPSSPHR